MCLRCGATRFIRDHRDWQLGFDLIHIYVTTVVTNDLRPGIFRRMYDNESGELSQDELNNGMCETGLDLTNEEMGQLVALFDRDGSGSVDYNESLRAVRVSCSPTVVTHDLGLLL